MKKSDHVAKEATALTLKISKFCRRKDRTAVVMACAGLIGHTLASLPPRARKIVRAGVNEIIDEFIEEWGK